jgi:hypothetical protein
MNPSISYSDISKEERKQLAAEAYRRNPALRAIRFASIFVPILVSGSFANYVAPSGDLSFLRLGAAIAGAVLVNVLIWEAFGRRRLRVEIEKLKRA